MAIRPDDTGFSSEAEKGILGKVGGIASKAAGVFAAGFVAKQGFDFLGGLVKDATESRRVLAETDQAIKATGGAAGVSAKEVAALADSLSKKTGIDDEQIQSAENLLLCLEESAQALTRDRGWVDHTGLAIGDEVLTYDPVDDTSRWEPIQDFYRYEVDTELIHWKSKQIDVKTTPHHRWWTVGTSGHSEFTPRFMTTEQISGHQYRVKIGGGLPGGFLPEPVLSDDIVELLGWVVTEGTYLRWKDQPSRVNPDGRLCALCNAAPARTRQGLARCEGCAQKPIQSGRSTPRPKVTAQTSQVSGIVFSQSQTANPKHVARIRELVDRLVRRGHEFTETQSLARYNGSIMSVWSFCGPLAREVRRLLPDKKLTPELLGMLTQAQAEMLLDTMLDGDGHRDAHGHRQYIQKDHGQLDVVAMLCAMLGIRTSVLGRGGDKDSLYLCATNRLKGNAVHAERVRYQGTVWCPQVRTGIFMARNRGRTFWTGNTFKDIRNETGKGNDVFNQATQAVLDLSKQFGGTEASAVQIGKALNDPIKGVTALSRVGVQFTEQQKDQIKVLVESGRTLEAQKIILGEINAQVGGQAAAQATAIDKLKVTYGNLREELGAKLLPIVDKVATFLADKLPGALDAAGRVVGPVIAKISQAIKGLFDLFIRGDFTGAFREAFGIEEDAPIIGVLLRIRDTALQVINFIKSNFKPILIGLAGVILTVVVPALVAWAAAQVAALAPFLLVGAAIAAVAAGVIYAYTHFKVFRDVIGAVVGFFTGTVVPAIGSFVSFVSEQFANLQNFVRENWSGIQEAIGHVIVVVQALIEQFIGTIQAIWRAWGDEILNIVRIVFDQIRNVVETVIGLISGLIRVGVALINGEWGAAWDAFKDILSTAWEFIKTTVENAFRLLREVVEGGISAVVGLIGEVPGKIIGALGDVGSLLFSVGEDLVRGLINGIKNFASAAANAAKDVVKGAVNAAKDFLGIGSPSKVFMEIGRQTMEGFTIGVDGSVQRVENSMTKILDAAAAVMASSGTGGSGGLTGAAKKYWDFAMSEGDWLNDWLTEVPAGQRDALRERARLAVAQKQSAVNSGAVAATDRFPATNGNGTMILSITGPLVNVEGSVIPGQEEELGRMAEQAVINMVRNGTVGREMSNRTMIISRR